jgi:hypothetical protein
MSLQSPEVIRAYTDGSRMSNGRVGFGVAFVDQSDIVHTISSRLPPGTTIFQAEGLAILEGVKWFTSHGTKYVKLELYSDSAAALTTVSTATGKATEIFIQIRATLRAIAGSLETGRSTWSFFPTVAAASVLRKVKVSYQLFQLLSGHCKLNAFLNRIQHASSPLCSCNEGEESIEHFILVCKCFETQRYALKMAVTRSCSNWPPTNLSEFVRSPSGVTALQNFVISSKRLNM